MPPPAIIIVYVSFIGFLELIQISALLYYTWTLCLRSPITKCFYRLRNNDSQIIDSKEIPLIECTYYVDL